MRYEDFYKLKFFLMLLRFCHYRFLELQIFIFLAIGSIEKWFLFLSRFDVYKKLEAITYNYFRDQTVNKLESFFNYLLF